MLHRHDVDHLSVPEHANPERSWTTSWTLSCINCISLFVSIKEIRDDWKQWFSPAFGRRIYQWSFDPKVYPQTPDLLLTRGGFSGVAGNPESTFWEFGNPRKYLLRIWGPPKVPFGPSGDPRKYLFEHLGPPKVPFGASGTPESTFCAPKSPKFSAGFAGQKPPKVPFVHLKSLKFSAGFAG